LLAECGRSDAGAFLRGRNAEHLLGKKGVAERAGQVLDAPRDTAPFCEKSRFSGIFSRRESLHFETFGALL
jgi:hypothetical protein